jgi:hypothetical protein
MIESTDLTEETIGGMALMDKYDDAAIEKVFGKEYKKVEDESYYTYLYTTQQFIVDLKVDKDNNLISMGIGLIDNSFSTNRGITKGSTLSEVEWAYGTKYLKKRYSDFMGSGEGYFITYVDKSNKSQIIFEFNIQNKQESLKDIRLSKY